MPGTVFSAAVRRGPSGAIIDLGGDIDRSSADALTAAYAEATNADGTGPVVLNFSNVDYINSTGIAVIVTLLAKARAEGRQLRAFGLSPHYEEIFQITRLSDFMSIHHTEPEALAHQ